MKIDDAETCDICGGTDRLRPDYCRECLEVRGILCFMCQTVIDCADQDPERLLDAVDYLTRVTDADADGDVLCGDDDSVAME